MSAMSYHPVHRGGSIARAYWSFVSRYQQDTGYLHRRRGQWYLVELASRFPFPSIREILVRNMDWAARRQRRDGGFQKEDPATSACQVALAYSRHGMYRKLLSRLRYDPLPLVRSLETPLGLRTRREVLQENDENISERLIRRISGEQSPDGSWGGLILRTSGAIHDLLDCGSSPDADRVRTGCSWLLEQQRTPNIDLFPNTPPIDLTGMFYTTRVSAEVDYFNELHPEHAKADGNKSCLTLLPIYQTGAALAALCRSGMSDNPGVERGFHDLLRIRGPGGHYYTDHWCACQAKRWINTNKEKFGSDTSGS